MKRSLIPIYMFLMLGNRFAYCQDTLSYQINKFPYKDDKVIMYTLADETFRVFGIEKDEGKISRRIRWENKNYYMVNEGRHKEEKVKLLDADNFTLLEVSLYRKSSFDITDSDGNYFTAKIKDKKTAYFLNNEHVFTFKSKKRNKKKMFDVIIHKPSLLNQEFMYLAPIVANELIKDTYDKKYIFIGATAVLTILTVIRVNNSSNEVPVQISSP